MNVISPPLFLITLKDNLLSKAKELQGIDLYGRHKTTLHDISQKDERNGLEVCICKIFSHT